MKPQYALIYRLNILYTTYLLSSLTYVDISSYFGDKHISIVLYLVLGRHPILYQDMYS